ncbi:MULTISPECIES: RelA/SpoT domain-containing protein [Pseudomonas syringae group]|uniref:RelA/SpoT domain-containing protein n=1 Tax=Pseudomonas syringae group TaxID=136849 RepID=UPI0001E285E3|nr:hypothetical protein [Pseudomonas coronafaciens]KPX32211.1 hypothetical protein ALO77_200123 [Pseudomonas coronafaciens pv. garcae]RMV88034.1 hypothetical protein ALP02_200216 [Pseudomonas coronafaciens pv. garcae]
MINNLTESDFRSRNRIADDDWEKSAMSWKDLQAIGVDHESQQAQLGEYAGMLARMMQQYPGVHSVRWRVKETEHVLEKIVRKRAEGSEKYTAISVENYFTVITDLVGIRALHLFKNEVSDIDSAIREHQHLHGLELPVVYARKGDPQSEETYPSERFAWKEHSAGYRSVHYIIEAQPQKRKVYTEVQVRTIFEEGWSEIDHRVRYPNFLSDETVNVFLAIFNRLAGQADEMGSFVQSLAEQTQAVKGELEAARQENRRSLEAMEGLIADLQKKDTQHVESQQSVSELRKELDKMKSAAIASASRPSNLLGWASLDETASESLFRNYEIILGKSFSGENFTKHQQDSAVKAVEALRILAQPESRQVRSRKKKDE